MVQLTEPGQFAADDGTVPDEVRDVLAARGAGRAPLREVVAVLSRHRMLVPLLEVAGDALEGDGADPCAGADTAVAAVSVREPDGSPLGLAFSGLASLARWDPAARPLPVQATRAAAAVLADGGRALLVDSGSEHAVRITGVALARLASGEAWPEPWEDPAVRSAVAAELGPVLASGEVQVRLAPPVDAGPGPARAPRATPEPASELTLQVRFRPDLGQDLVDQRVEVIARRMSLSADLREVFDGVLAVQLQP